MKCGYSFCLALLVVFAAAEKLAAENDVAAIHHTCCYPEISP